MNDLIRTTFSYLTTGLFYGYFKIGFNGDGERISHSLAEKWMQI